MSLAEDEDYDFDGYEPLAEAVKQKDWKKATEYVKINRRKLEEICRRKNLEKEFRMMIDAAMEYDMQQWEFVEQIVKVVTPETLEYKISTLGFTLLHAAVMSGDIKYVKMLINKNPYLTQIRGVLGSSDARVPLCVVAVVAINAQKEILEYLYPVTRDIAIHGNRTEEDPSPFSGVEGASLLMGLINTNSYGTCAKLVNILRSSGIALSICQQFPDLVKESSSDLLRRKKMSTYDMLAIIVEQPFAFQSGARMTWWERCIYSLIEVDIGCQREHNIQGDTKRDEENQETTKDSSTSGKATLIKRLHLMLCLMPVPCIKQLYDHKMAHKQVEALAKMLFTQLTGKKNANNTEERAITFVREKDRIIFCQIKKLLKKAIKFGTTEIVLECFRVFPILCMDGGDGDNTLKMIIGEREEKIFNYVCETRELNGIDFGMAVGSRESILHYAADLPTGRQLNSIPGAVFQMHREIQWFKGVENSMHPKDRFIRNKDGYTAQFLFTKKHKELMEEGEEWLKDMSGSCMLVGALVATVAFAAAITVPGGNISDNSKNSRNGYPVFLDKSSFMVFSVANALSLFASITSALMFLTVYTSPYREEHFLKSLPQKLIIGFGTLYISIATILVSFGAAFTIVLGDRFSRAPILVGLLGCVPVILFGFLQFPLFVKTVYSTYWPIRFWKYSNTAKKETRFASWKKLVRSWFQSS